MQPPTVWSALSDPAIDKAERPENTLFPLIVICGLRFCDYTLQFFVVAWFTLLSDMGLLYLIHYCTK